MKRRSWDRPARVEMMPLIDVVFLLLVVFIFSVMTMVRSYVVPVDLPQIGTGEVADLPAVLVITIEQDGSVSVGGEASAAGELVDTVKSRRELEPELAVLIHADQNARHGDVARVLDLVRTAGQERVLLVADELAEAGPDEH